MSRMVAPYANPEDQQNMWGTAALHTG